MARRSKPERPAAMKSGTTQTNGASLLVYGVPGVGKTRLIGSGDEPTLILRPPTDHTDSITDPSNITEMVVEDWAGMTEAFTYLQQGGSSEFAWVWLDSVSLFQDHGLDDIWQDVIAKRPDRKQYGLDKGEYGVNMFRLSTWVRNMVGLANEGRINFGMTAHPYEWYDPVAEEDKWAPFVQGKNMSPKICGYMNMVAYYELRERSGKATRRVLRSRAGENYVAKDQFDAFPNGRLVDPSWPDVEKAIKAARRRRAGRKQTTRPKRTANRRKPSNG